MTFLLRALGAILVLMSLSTAPQAQIRVSVTDPGAGTTEGAVLELELLDISRADAASVQLSTQRFLWRGDAPVYELAYDAALIDERMRYAVAAKLWDGGSVTHRTTIVFPVLTGTAGTEVRIELERMASTAVALEGEWEVFELGGRLLTTDTLPNLTFLPENQLAAYAGCNRFKGSFEQEGSTLSFPPTMAGTLMACPPPYDELERTFVQTLPEVTEVQEAAHGLTLLASSGVTLMRLRKAP